MASGNLTWHDEQRAAIGADHTLLASFQNLKYANVGMLALLTYDHAITFNLEVRRIWTLNWRLPKILFMTTRYFLPPFLFYEGLSNTVYNEGAAGKILYYFLSSIMVKRTPTYTCLNFRCTARLYTAFPTVVAITSMELMLILRVLALYSNGRRMARFLITAFSVQLTIWSGLAIVILVNTHPIPGERTFTGCLFAVPKYGVVGWVPGLIFELLLIVLTIHKARKYGRFSPTLKVLTRDSVVYFLTITGLFVFNIIYYLVGRHILAPSLLLPTNVVTCIAASRLTMNIRRFTMDEGMETLAQNGLGTIAHPGAPRTNDRTPVPFRPRQHVPTASELAHEEENELRIMNMRRQQEVQEEEEHTQ